MRRRWTSTDPNRSIMSKPTNLVLNTPASSTVLWCWCETKVGLKYLFYHADTRGWCGTIRMHGMNFHWNNKTRWLNKTLTTIIVYIFSRHETNDLHRPTMTSVSPPGMKTYHTMNNDFPRTQLYGSRLSGVPTPWKKWYTHFHKNIVQTILLYDTKLIYD